MGCIIDRRCRSIAFVWGVGLLLGALSAGAVRAEESPLLEQVDQWMLDIGAQLKNAKRRLSMSSGEIVPTPSGESGLGLTCCTDNLRTIAKKLQLIRASVDRIAAYYAEQENGMAMGHLGQMDASLRAISAGAVIFGRAPDEKSASAALTGFVRPWNGFRNSLQSLKLCCPVPLPVDPVTWTEVAPDDGKRANEDEADEKGKKKKSKGESGGDGSED